MSKGTGKEGGNKGELLNRRYADKAMLLLSPISLNKSQIQEGQQPANPGLELSYNSRAKSPDS